jgi:hypothetical protein
MMPLFSIDRIEAGYDMENGGELSLTERPDVLIKDTGTEDTISQFGRRNQMSSSNILSIHGLKKKHQFQDSNRDIQW